VGRVGREWRFGLELTLFKLPTCDLVILALRGRAKVCACRALLAPVRANLAGHLARPCVGYGRELRRGSTSRP
jgi:hypothetical protein